ncbi:pickpocket protein 28-like [Musca domestica]|uniref:Pickpocket protein 28-like n=1 Tax=Musca domestica TaxID=7370 RepID=A0A1I8N2I9_MUSDO|nr:pickpocket protein 28-like [Musca domestica]
MACPASNLEDISSMDLEEIPAAKDKTSETLDKKSLSLSLKEIYEEFCSNTSIHGFQYFGQRRQRKEVGFWIIVFIITIYLCTSIIVKIYMKWCETPVIVSFSEKSTPIWSIPFPAITICPETKRALKEKDKDYGHLLASLQSYAAAGQTLSSNFSLKELHETLTLMHICRSEIDQFYEIPKLNLEPFDYFETMDGMLPPMASYLVLCKWFGKFENCQNLFSKVYTDGGICYTFNSLKAQDLFRSEVVQHQISEKERNDSRILNWSLEEGYASDVDLLTYPARVLSSGSDAGFQIYLQSFPQELDYTCNGAVQGFKILLHSPDATPSVAKHFVRISGDKEILIAVKPKMIITSKDISAYDPDRRRCFLNKERQLRFYKVYSQDNCERECLSNFTYSQCGCVRFSMPRFPEMEICGEDKIKCYRKAKEQLRLQQFSEGLKKANGPSMADCNCMPACTSLDYDTEISEGIFDVESTQRAFNVTNLFTGKVSLVEIYFKENQFITSRRSELYGVSDLLANFGGVFGLFMGISILSVVELFYHCTLRLWSNMTLSSRVN